MNKVVQKYITDVLSLMAIKIPMHPARHNLTLNDKGILTLNFIIGEMWHSWVFTEDEELDPVILVEEIVYELKQSGVEI